ncbi:MAG: peptide-methionine (S)-S-oxide reductase, partial [Parasphingorhabdus sp.]
RAAASAGIERGGADRSEPVVTSIEGPATWYLAEDYHQQYWADEGRSNPYCIATIPPKLQKLRTKFADKLKD